MNDQKIIDFVESNFQTKKPVRTVFETDTGTAFDDFINSLDFGPELTSINSLGGNQQQQDNEYWAYLEEQYFFSQQDSITAMRMGGAGGFGTPTKKILQYVVSKMKRENPEHYRKIFLWDWDRTLEGIDDNDPKFLQLWPIAAIVAYNLILRSQLSEYGNMIAAQIEELI